MNLSDFQKSFEAHPSATMTQFKACLCGSQFRLTDLPSKRCYSGVVNYDERLCASCRTETQDFSRVVCVGCKRLSLFLKPQTCKTGFKFERGRHYHVRGCSHCSPTSASSSVLEHEQFCRTMKIVTNIELDLVQEIEQKRLTFDEGREKLAAEMHSPEANENHSTQHR